MIKTINTIMKKISFFFIFFFLLLISNKLLLSNLAIFSFEKWIDKNITVENFNISYRKNEILVNNIIVHDKQNLNENIFTAEKILINFKPNSLFTKLIIIENIEIEKPILNLKFDITNKNNNLIKDNIGIYKSVEQKENPKIYPKKIVDINFLIENLNLESFLINIIRLDNNTEEKVKLSNMQFNKFGNELGYKHYKDIFRIILIDLVMRISDEELRKIIKSFYIK